MFEKEAKKYRRIHGITGGCDTVFKDGAEFGYNKANEWHYVKDGDLPNHDCLVLVHWESAIGSNTVITYWKKGKFLQPYNRKDITVAWKEIVLPKESE